MNRRALDTRLVGLPIGFALVCLVLTFAMFRAFGGSLPFEAEGYRVEVPLMRAGNVVPGSDVQIAGVDIGRVVKLRRDGDRALAELELESRFAPLRVSALAIARTKTLLGEGYVEIAPGPTDAAAIPDGGRLAAKRVGSPVQLDEFLESFEPRTRSRLRELFGGMAEAYGGTATQALNESLGHAGPFSANLDAVVTALNGQSSELKRLFARSGDVLGALGRRAGVLRAALHNSNAVLQTTAQRDRELAATVRSLPPFLRRLRSTAGVVEAASADLRPATAALRSAAPQVRPTIDAIRATGPSFRAVFRQLPAIASAGQAGLPALRRILAAAPTAFRALYPTAREVIPLAQLLGLYRDSAVVGAFTNAGSGTNGKLVGPGGRIISRVGGTMTLWNESVGGYVKRLPTSRSNPYPRPDGFTEIPKQGFLKAYDCRHLHNPLLVPPTGTGTPPCILQGPWELNGRSAYYPRLQMAPP
jgi:virulence factor Mce-like protein